MFNRSLYFILIVQLFISCQQPNQSNRNKDEAPPESTPSFTVIETLEDLPNPSAQNTGWLYFIIDRQSFYYCDGSAYIEIDVSGTDGTPGSDGVDGISINWLGALASHPDSPSLNDAYYNTTNRKSYIWDGDTWEILTQDGLSTQSLNVSGIVPSGNYLNLKHDLSRNDLTFNAQFTHSNIIYSLTDYPIVFEDYHLGTSFPVLSGQSSLLFDNGIVVVAQAGSASAFCVYNSDGSIRTSQTTYYESATSSVRLAKYATNEFLILFFDTSTNTYIYKIYSINGDELTSASGGYSNIMDIESINDGSVLIAHTRTITSWDGNTYKYADLSIISPNGNKSYNIYTTVANGSYNCNQIDIARLDVDNFIVYHDYTVNSTNIKRYAKFSTNTGIQNSWTDFSPYGGSSSSASNIRLISNPTIGFSMLYNIINGNTYLANYDTTGSLILPVFTLATTPPNHIHISPENEIFFFIIGNSNITIHRAKMNSPNTFLSSTSFSLTNPQINASGSKFLIISNTTAYPLEKTNIHLEKVDMNEVRAWNHSGISLEMVISVSQ